MEGITKSPNALRQAQQDEQSLETSPTSGDDVSNNETTSSTVRRTRACVSCRAMKIKCRWLNDQEACVACSKVNRECIMPGPPKKRQKNKHKFAELEQKINALTEALIAKKTSSDNASKMTQSNNFSTPASTQSRRSDNTALITNSVTPLHDGPPRTMGVLSAQMGEASCERPVDFARPPGNDVPYVDVVDQGKLDLPTACEIFKHWQTKMHPHFPFIVLAPLVRAEDVRTARPMLFLAVLAAASPAIRPDLQPEIVYELNKEMSQRVLIYGEKSFDLIQAMLLYVKYYSKPRYAKDLIFNQYIHCAAVMCLDVGIGKRLTTESIQNPIEEAEIRRTWLATYYVGSSSALLLRHPTLIRFSPYVEQCMQFLLDNPYAAPSDQWLCALCRLQHIAEDASITFGLDDRSTPISFSDPRTLHHLKAFEQRINSWEKTVPSTVDQRFIRYTAASGRLYCNEVAIHESQSVVDNWNKPDTTPSSQIAKASPMQSALIDALSTCVASSHQMLESWLALDLDTRRCLPNLFLVWNVYSMVALIKIHGIVYSPGSKLEDIFASDLRIEHYLDSVSRRLAESAQDGHSPQSEGFGYIFKKLKSWYGQRKGPMYKDPEMGPVDPRTAFLGNDEDAYRSKITKEFAERYELPETNGTAIQAAAPPPMNAPSDFNAAFNAVNYNINWDELNFSANELNTFDEYMNDPGWLGYLM